MQAKKPLQKDTPNKAACLLDIIATFQVDCNKEFVQARSFMAVPHPASGADPDAPLTSTSHSDRKSVV